MSKQGKEENPITVESTTSDSEMDSDSSDLVEDTEDSDTDSDMDADGVIGDNNAPFRFIFDEGAQARSLNGIAYGIDESGSYFVICKDGDTVSGLLVHALIDRNIKDGILLPISKPVEVKTIADPNDGK